MEEQRELMVQLLIYTYCKAEFIVGGIPTCVKLVWGVLPLTFNIINIV